MATDDLLLDVDNGIGWITFNRPETLNAFTTDILAGTRQALLDWAHDPSVRVIVITGTGRGFCSGGNVRSMEENVHANEGAAAPRDPVSGHHAIVRLIHAMNDCPKPVIASVNGVAAGAGWELCLQADLRIAAEEAYLKPAGLRIGMIPGDGSVYFLPQMVGYPKAAEILFTERDISSAEALRLGIFNQVVPGAELHKATLDLASEIAAKAPIALQLTKKALKLGIKGDLHDVTDYLSIAIQMTRETEDHKEGLRALREKRPPVFEGR